MSGGTARLRGSFAFPRRLRDPQRSRSLATAPRTRAAASRSRASAPCSRAATLPLHAAVSRKPSARCASERAVFGRFCTIFIAQSAPAREPSRIALRRSGKTPKRRLGGFPIRALRQPRALNFVQNLPKLRDPLARSAPCAPQAADDLPIPPANRAIEAFRSAAAPSKRSTFSQPAIHGRRMPGRSGRGGDKVALPSRRGTGRTRPELPCLAGQPTAFRKFYQTSRIKS